MWLGGSPLLLASTSSARRRLLSSAGLPVETEPPAVDEAALAREHADLAPAALAGALARAKALAVSRRHPDRWVVGGDQVLLLAGEVLFKAPDRASAADQLLRLSGRPHRLLSAAVLARGGTVLSTVDAAAELTMRRLGPDAVARYLDLAGDAVLHSVGCYELEGLGIHLFDAVEGEFATILGLPLRPLLACLRHEGLLAIP